MASWISATRSDPPDLSCKQRRGVKTEVTAQGQGARRRPVKEDDGVPAHRNRVLALALEGDDLVNELVIAPRLLIADGVAEGDDVRRGLLNDRVPDDLQLAQDGGRGAKQGGCQNQWRGGFSRFCGRAARPARNPRRGRARAVTDGLLRAYVEDVVVSPDWRGTGVGRALLAGLMEQLEPIPVVTLFCSADVCARLGPAADEARSLGEECCAAVEGPGDVAPGQPRTRGSASSRLQRRISQGQWQVLASHRLSGARRAGSVLRSSSISVDTASAPATAACRNTNQFEDRPGAQASSPR
jgi:GNAT superfamily N-acetyltransferase